MKIVCIGRNYLKHARELNNEVPEQPLIFIKPETALFKGGIYAIPEFTDDLHFECEWVLKIGETTKGVPLDHALNCIDEMTLGIDFTARDIQSELKKKGHPWERAKAFDGAAVVGKWKKFTPETRYFQFYQNKTKVQDGDIHQMIFPPSVLVAEISKYFTLEPGDLIFTGTPAGVGSVISRDVLTGILEGEELLRLEIQ